MAYEVVMPYHLHMPSYFLETFTEYPYADRLTKSSAVFFIPSGAFYFTAFYFTAFNAAS